VGISLCPNLKIGTTEAIFRLSGKTPSHMLSLTKFDRRGACKYFDNFRVRTEISSCPHDFLESNPLMSVSISSGVVGDKNLEFTWRGRRYVLIFASEF